jgi:hypothetical protein
MHGTSLHKNCVTHKSETTPEEIFQVQLEAIFYDILDVLLLLLA